MAFLSGIFGTPAATPTPAAPSAQQPNSATAPQNQPPAPGNQQQQQPNNAAAQAQPANSAMDTLMQLITPSPEVIAQRQKQQENQPQGFLPAVPQEQLSQTLNSLDFTQAIPQEQMAAALGGDAKALAAVINSAVRAGVGANLQMSHTLVEQGARAATDRWGSSLDSRFNELQLRNHTPQNPALQHPLAKSMVQSLSKQIANANPNLTPQEVAKQAEENFLLFTQEISGSANKAQESAKNANAPKERNWLDYLDTPEAGANT